MSSNTSRKPTYRRNVHPRPLPPPENNMNDIPLLPPPVLVATTSSTSTIIVGHDSLNTSKQLKKKNIKDLGDQVVPQAKRGTERPVIEHNEYDHYGRFPSDTPVLRYRSSQQLYNNNTNNSENQENNPTNSNNDIIVID